MPSFERYRKTIEGVETLSALTGMGNSGTAAATAAQKNIINAILSGRLG